jgi:hypothetical protein
MKKSDSSSIILAIKAMVFLLIIGAIIIIKGEINNNGAALGFPGWILVIIIIYISYRFLIQAPTSNSYYNYLNTYFNLSTKDHFIVEEYLKLINKGKFNEAANHLEQSQNVNSSLCKYLFCQMKIATNNSSTDILADLLEFLNEDKKNKPLGDMYYLAAYGFRLEGNYEKTSYYLELLNNSDTYFFHQQKVEKLKQYIERKRTLV